MKEWFDTFFSEKELDSRVFRISDGVKIHVVESSMVKELIMAASFEEQRIIKLFFIQLDLQQGDITGFLKHLATLFVEKQRDKQLIS